MTQEQIEAEAKLHSLEWILGELVDIAQMIRETKELMHTNPAEWGEHLRNLEVHYADGRRLLAAKERQQR